MIQAILGFLFALFIPGFFIVQIFYEELKWLEKIALSIALSIAMSIAVGLFLGYNESMKNLTGGITTFNVWLYEIAITFILSIIYLFKIWRRKHLKPVHSKSRTTRHS